MIKKYLAILLTIISSVCFGATAIVQDGQHGPLLTDFSVPSGMTLTIASGATLSIAGVITGPGTISLSTGTYGILVDTGLTAGLVGANALGQLQTVVSIPTASISGLPSTFVTQFTATGSNGINFGVTNSNSTPNLTATLSTITITGLNNSGTDSTSGAATFNSTLVLIGFGTFNAGINTTSVTATIGTYSGALTIGSLIDNGTLTATTGTFSLNLTDQALTAGLVGANASGTLQTVTQISAASLSSGTLFTIAVANGIGGAGAVSPGATVNLSLGNITPTSINTAGNSTLSGTLTIGTEIVTGTESHSGAVTFGALITDSASLQVFGTATLVSVYTTNITNSALTAGLVGASSLGLLQTVTAISAASLSGGTVFTVAVANGIGGAGAVAPGGTVNLSLDNITPTSINAAGNSTLSGTLTIGTAIITTNETVSGVLVTQTISSATASGTNIAPNTLSFSVLGTGTASGNDYIFIVPVLGSTGATLQTGTVAFTLSNSGGVWANIGTFTYNGPLDVLGTLTGGSIYGSVLTLSNNLFTSSLAATASISVATTATIGTTMTIGTALNDVGTLSVSGATTLGGTLTVTGAGTMQGLTLTNLTNSALTAGLVGANSLGLLGPVTTVTVASLSGLVSTITVSGQTSVAITIGSTITFIGAGAITITTSGQNITFNAANGGGGSVTSFTQSSPTTGFTWLTTNSQSAISTVMSAGALTTLSALQLSNSLSFSNAATNIAVLGLPTNTSTNTSAVATTISPATGSGQGTGVYLTIQGLVYGSTGSAAQTLVNMETFSLSSAGNNWALNVAAGTLSSTNLTISGTTLTLADTTVTSSANFTINGALTLSGVAAGTQVSYLGLNSNGQVVTFSPGASGTVTQVTSPNATLVLTLTTSAVTVDINLGHSNTYTVSQTFASTISVSNLSFDNTTQSIVIGQGALATATTATGNVAIGYQALNLLQTGTYNTVIGFQALAAGTTAGNNVAIGYDALFTVTNASYDVAVGYRAARSNNAGNGQNVAIGANAMDSSTTATNDTAVGYLALNHATAGENAAIGQSALYNITTGYDNVGIGSNTAYNATSSHDIIAIGYDTLYNLTTGIDNIAIGLSASSGLTTGSLSVAIGYQAMHTGIVTGSGSIAIGYLSLDNLTTGSYNVAIGNQALQTTTNGYMNIAIGYQALNLLTTGSNDIAFGASSSYNMTTGNNNFTAGYQAGALLTTGTNNVAIGYAALFTTTNGYNNIVFGNSASYALTTGHDNFFAGNGTGKAATTATNNIAIGSGAFGSSVDTNNNYDTAIGVNALSGPHSVTNAIAMGTNAAANLHQGSDIIVFGQNVLLNTVSGSDIIAIGQSALINMELATASEIIALGNNTGNSISPTATTILNDTFIGDQTAQGGVTSTNATVIGANVSLSSAQSGVILLGTGDGTTGGSGSFSSAGWSFSSGVATVTLSTTGATTFSNANVYMTALASSAGVNYVESSGAGLLTQNTIVSDPRLKIFDTTFKPYGLTELTAAVKAGLVGKFKWIDNLPTEIAGDKLDHFGFNAKVLQDYAPLAVVTVGKGQWLEPADHDRPIVAWNTIAITQLAEKVNEQEQEIKDLKQKLNKSK